MAEPLGVAGWRTALFVARKDVAYALHTRITLLWLFLMPIVFMYFIGTTTAGGVASVDGPVRLAAVGSEDAGFLAGHLLQRLAERGFEVDPGADGDASPRLEVPGDFTAGVLDGAPVTLTYRYEAGAPAARYDLLRVQRAAYTVLADVIVSGAADADDGAAALARLRAMPPSLTLTVRPAGARKRIPDGFQQAVPGMILMFTMLVLLTSGAIDLLVDRRHGVLRRLASAPVARGWIVAGKWGGKMALALVQILFAMLVGTLLFAMQWGPDVAMVVVVLLAWGAFCASLGLLLGSVGRTEAQISGLGIAATMLLAALGGCWWPIEVTPPAMQALQKLLPSGWTMDALHRLISFRSGAAGVLPHLAALLLGAAALGWQARRRLRFD